AEKAQKLAKDVVNNAEARPVGYCARYVKESIERSGLGTKESGHAYQYADVLSRNKNFKEINVAGKDLKKLPAGCVIVYPRGDAGYDKDYGHIEIALGNGKAASDFVRRSNVKASDNARVFVPVSA
ncbi:MAG: hypothetical protein LBJ74_03895, partial [Heliobacteriaceae bacterium]|nr:hypothetical protein [Heliobacteriaceae bacterium]